MTTHEIPKTLHFMDDKTADYDITLIMYLQEYKITSHCIHSNKTRIEAAAKINQDKGYFQLTVGTH